MKTPIMKSTCLITIALLFTACTESQHHESTEMSSMKTKVVSCRATQAPLCREYYELATAKVEEIRKGCAAETFAEGPCPRREARASCWYGSFADLVMKGPVTVGDLNVQVETLKTTCAGSNAIFTIY